jgi:periplasmic protein TonB
MQDRVADVLAQRAALDRGAGVGVAISVLLHAALAGAAVYAALHAPPPQAVRAINIQFAPMPAPAPVTPATKATPAAPKIAEPKPVIAEPKPEPPVMPPPKPDKNTVPLSPFGQSTKKGSERPAPPPAPPQAAPATSTAPEVAIGGSGITGLEGGDFPHTLYLSAMHKKIGSFWYRPPSVTPGITAVVYFRIDRDGVITEAKVATPSGNSTFDRSALSAVRSASPLNPLPYAYSGTYLGVHLTFR